MGAVVYCIFSAIGTILGVIFMVAKYGLALKYVVIGVFGGGAVGFVLAFVIILISPLRR